MRYPAAMGTRDGANEVATPRAETPARRAGKAAAAYKDPATTRGEPTRAPVPHTSAGTSEDWTKEYQRVSPEKPSYAVLPSITEVTASSPGRAGTCSGPWRGVRSTQRPSVRRPSGLSVP